MRSANCRSAEKTGMNNQPEKPLTRLVRRYRIVRKTSNFVYVAWEQKMVADPDNSWHMQHAKGWLRRQRKLLLHELPKYSRTPPEV